jgi:hypothetical protein
MLNRLESVMVRVVEQVRARGEQVALVLARNRSCTASCPADSQEGRALLERVGATTEQLPVVVTFDGLVLRDPSSVAWRGLGPMGRGQPVIS